MWCAGNLGEPPTMPPKQGEGKLHGVMQERAQKWKRKFFASFCRNIKENSGPPPRRGPSFPTQPTRCVHTWKLFKKDRQRGGRIRKYFGRCTFAVLSPLLLLSRVPLSIVAPPAKKKRHKGKGEKRGEIFSHRHRRIKCKRSVKGIPKLFLSRPFVKRGAMRWSIIATRDPDHVRTVFAKHFGFISSFTHMQESSKDRTRNGIVSAIFLSIKCTYCTKALTQSIFLLRTKCNSANQQKS